MSEYFEFEDFLHFLWRLDFGHVNVDGHVDVCRSTCSSTAHVVTNASIRLNLLRHSDLLQLHCDIFLQLVLNSLRSS
jgi:hypothetical protein